MDLDLPMPLLFRLELGPYKRLLMQSYKMVVSRGGHLTSMATQAKPGHIILQQCKWTLAKDMWYADASLSMNV